MHSSPTISKFKNLSKNNVLKYPTRMLSTCFRSLFRQTLFHLLIQTLCNQPVSSVVLIESSVFHSSGHANAKHAFCLCHLPNSNVVAFYWFLVNVLIMIPLVYEPLSFTGTHFLYTAYLYPMNGSFIQCETQKIINFSLHSQITQNC